MNVNAFNGILSVLSFAALVIGVVLLFPGARRKFGLELGSGVAWMAFAVALVATAGSLVYSEYFGFEPCRLCWYQRIAMYPLVAITAVGAIRRDRNLGWYGLPLAGIGFAISVYHYLIQTFPGLSSGACTVGVPCSAKYVNTYGFMSIPFMAGAGFLAIISLLITYRSPEEAN